MIPVTRLDGSTLILNAEQIERIEQTPDTLIALVNGETLLVQESPETLVERVLGYKRQIHDGHTTPPLRLAGGARP